MESDQLRSVSPNLATRLEEQLEILARARLLLPQSKAPYSAHIRLRYADGRESDFLLGAVFRRGEGLTILDWRTAPLAEVFFAYAEGEEYEIDLGDRKLAGKVLRRNLVRFEDRDLQELQWPNGALRRLDGRWVPGAGARCALDGAARGLPRPGAGGAGAHATAVPAPKAPRGGGGGAGGLAARPGGVPRDGGRRPCPAGDARGPARALRRPPAD